jgi:ArsR family transcriptional regulator, arsenate/arsenite/antimonite-responsive transcriptional repressor
LLPNKSKLWQKLKVYSKIETFQQKLIQNKLMYSSTLPSSEIVARFHALSEPLRLQIIDLLREEELCVCDLCDSLNVAQSKLSFHLKVLREAKLLRSRQEGRWIYYSLDLSQFVVLEQYLAEFRRFSPIVPSRACRDDD